MTPEIVTLDTAMLWTVQNTATGKMHKQAIKLRSILKKPVRFTATTGERVVGIILGVTEDGKIMVYSDAGLMPDLNNPDYVLIW
jgi:biotin-(acetyl-CoA carboxylase) ligase